MIASLSGTLLLRDDPYFIVEVGGVGYKVVGTSDVLANLPVKGGQVSVVTYTHVREDILELYGFPEYADLKLFELFISVSGIGPKTALGIFSLGKRSDILSAIVKADVSFFTGVPRLGKKNAQKLLIELKNKVGGADIDLTSEEGAETAALIDALRGFGFDKDEAQQAIKGIAGRGETIEEKIKLALQYMGK